jgi:hypothetical protein
VPAPAPPQPVANPYITPQQMATLVQLYQLQRTPLLGLIITDLASAGGGPVLGLAMGAVADALTGNVSAARQLSQADANLAIAAASALGLGKLAPAINAMASVQTKLIVGVAKGAGSVISAAGGVARKAAHLL